MNLPMKVEMLFAHVKHVLGLKRVRRRVPCGAIKEVSLVATAQISAQTNEASSGTVADAKSPTEKVIAHMSARRMLSVQYVVFLQIRHLQNIRCNVVERAPRGIKREFAASAQTTAL